MKIKKEYKKRINILLTETIELSLFLKMSLYFQITRLRSLFLADLHSAVRQKLPDLIVNAGFCIVQ